MASKDGTIPGFKNSEETDGASDEDLSSAQGGLDDTGAAAAVPSPPPLSSACTTPPPQVNEEPEYTPETWALSMMRLVRNPPAHTEKGGFILDSEDSLSPPEQHMSYPSDPSPIARKKATAKTKPAFVSKKHARQESFSSSSSSVSGISISSSSSEDEGESPVAKRIRMEPKNLVYSWDSLLLGKELGSVALNQHLTQRHGTLSQLTSLETLQIVQSTRLETIVPPEGSKLSKVPETTRQENKELYGLDKDDNDNDAFKTCARLYESMLNQDVAQNRRQIQQLSPSQLVGRLEHLEHAVASLKERETKTLNASRELKLLNNAEICKLMGFRTPLEKYNSRPPPSPHHHQAHQQHHSPPVQPVVARPSVKTIGPPIQQQQQQGTAVVQQPNQSSQKAPTTSLQPKQPPPASASSTQLEFGMKDSDTTSTLPSEGFDGKLAASKEKQPGTASK